MTDDEILDEANFGDTIGTKAKGVLGKIRDAGIGALGQMTGIRTPRSGSRLSVRILADELTNRWLGYLSTHKTGGNALEGNADDLRHFIERYFGTDTLNSIEPTIAKVTGTARSGGAPGAAAPGNAPAGGGNPPGGGSGGNVLQFPQGGAGGAAAASGTNSPPGTGPGVSTSFQHSYNPNAPSGANAPAGNPAAAAAMGTSFQHTAAPGTGAARSANVAPGGTPRPTVGPAAANAAARTNPAAATNGTPAKPANSMNWTKAQLEDQLKDVGRDIAKEYQRSNGKDTPALQQLERDQQAIRDRIAAHPGDDAQASAASPATTVPPPAAGTSKPMGYSTSFTQPGGTQQPSPTPQRAATAPAAAKTDDDGLTIPPRPATAADGPPAFLNRQRNTPKDPNDDGLTIPPKPGTPQAQPEVPDFLKRQRNISRPAPIVPATPKRPKGYTPPNRGEPTAAPPQQKAWNDRKAGLMRNYDQLTGAEPQPNDAVPTRRFGQKGEGDANQPYNTPPELNKPAFGKKGTGAAPPLLHPDYRPAAQTHGADRFDPDRDLPAFLRRGNRQEPTVGNSTNTTGRQEPAPPTAEAPQAHQDNLVSNITDALSKAKTDAGRAKIKDQLRQWQANPTMMAKYPALKKINANESAMYRGVLVEYALYRSQIDAIFKALASQEMLNGNAFVGNNQPSGRASVFGNGPQGQPNAQQNQGNSQQGSGGNPVNNQITASQLSSARARLGRRMVSGQTFSTVDGVIRHAGGSMSLQALMADQNIQRVPSNELAALLYVVGTHP